MSVKEPQQRFEIGAEVVGSDGQHVGKVGFVVVRPPELHVTDIVVHTGHFLGRDLLVPVGDVDRVEGGRVFLSVGRDRIETYPDYLEIHYDHPADDWSPSPGFAYPSDGIIWPAGMYYPTGTSVEVNAPPGTVGLSKGMDVESSDGHKVGSIEGLETDQHAGEVTAIIVKHGLPFHRETLRLPVSAVAGINAGRVTLNLTKEEVEGMLRG